MNLLALSLAGLRDSRLTHGLNILLLGLGLGTVTLLILMMGALQDRLGRDAGGIDLVVGAKGSPLQLVLSTVFEADIPTGNIALSDADTLSHNALIAEAIPVALGDSVKSFRIVGTTVAYPTLYKAVLAQGRLWQQPMEAVLGADAARALRLKPGDTFVGAHGIGGEGHLHAENPYIVTGILAKSGSVIDRLALTSVESVWKVHEGHEHHASMGREITALLLRVKSPLAVVTLPHLINTGTVMQAAIPSLEYARLLSLAGFGLEILQALAAVLVIASGLGTLIALYTRLKAREQDLAVLRLLGASRLQLFSTILIEALLLSGLGAVAGLILGHGSAWGLTLWLPPGQALAGMDLGWRQTEWIIPVLALSTGLLAALIPAVTAYRNDVAHALTGGMEP